MKKVMIYLLGLMVVLGLPFGVSAATKAEISNTPVSSKDSEDGKSVIKTYDVYITTDNNEELGEATFGFEYGSAVTAFECSDAGDFKVADQATTAENKMTCKFAVPNEGTAKGEKILVGKVVLTAEKDAKDEDCYVKYIYENAQGKINPNTGIEIPYLIIAGGLVLATGVYFATRKKTALYKI